MDKQSAIKVAKKYLSLLEEKRFKIESAYLFGSYATGKFHEWSDIDIALVFKKVKNNFLLDIKLTMIGISLDSRLEPHSFDLGDFNNGHPVFAEVLKHGIKIQQK